MTLLLRDVEVEGRVTDVVVDGGRVTTVGPHPTSGADEVIDGGGGALIPGLWDHHIHLLSAAASLDSVRLTDDVDAADFEGRLRDAGRSAAPGAWLRVVGYHDSIAGDIDRHRLDQLVPDRPVRVQHRSGARWILNSAACDRAGLDEADHPAVERTENGTATGRLTGADAWLRARIGDDALPDLATLGRRLASYGLVGVTDATPDATADAWERLADAASDGRLPQRIRVTGGPELTTATPATPLVRGPVKIYLADHTLPDLDDVCRWIRDAHDVGRPVAFHSVTRSSLAFAVAALDQASSDNAGSQPGDRIEHGSVIPPDYLDALLRHRLTVVTQPAFVAERGDNYLTDVEPDDRDHLYRCASLLHAGIPVGGSTDAPFGDLDPWRAIDAAVNRRTRSGVVLGDSERVEPDRALDMFLTPPDDPGGERRRVVPGAPADLCLLDAPLDRALQQPSSRHVRLTIIDGTVVFSR